MLSENWKQPSQPLIYYSLNEVFYQGLKSNMKCPLLTLNYLKKLSESCFIFSPELELYSKSDNKKEIEIDIICISDGELLIGETKKNRE